MEIAVNRTILAFCVCLSAASAQAQSYTFNMLSSTSNAVVGSMTAFVNASSNAPGLAVNWFIPGAGTYYTFDYAGSFSVNAQGVPNFNYHGYSINDTFTPTEIGWDFQFSASGNTFNFRGYTYQGYQVIKNYIDYGTLVHAVTAVPEPETYALLLAGLALLGPVHRKLRIRSST